MGKVDLCLKDAKIPNEDSIQEAGIAIDEGKIVSISKSSQLPKAENVIDLDGKLLLPGIVDPHVHFREPGFTHKEDFYTGSKAALAGGVTTACEMPNTSPRTDSVKRFKKKKKTAESKSYIDFGLHALLTDSSEEGEKLLEEGATSLKLYPELTDDSNISAFKDKSTIITVHPENPFFLGEVEDTENSVENFIQSRPEKAESSEILNILSYVSKPYLHFCHVTTQEAINIVGREKRKGNISCEVTPHHLLLDLSNLREQGSVAKTYPPIRSPKNKKSLLKALENGIIDIVATDHAPHTKEEKQKGIMESPPGIAGIETSLPLIFTLVRKGKLSLNRMIEAMCSYPAKIFGLYNENGVQKGTLKPGADADIVVIDQNKKWKIKGKNLHGKTKFTPFEGLEVEGKPYLTIVRGEIMYENNEIVGEKGYGKFIPRKS